MSPNSISYKYICETCNYKCNKPSEMTKHNSTRKHKNLQNPISEITKKSYSCNCGKIYKHSPSLYAHKKKCYYINNDNNAVIARESQPQPQNDIVAVLLEQNNMFQEIIMKNEERILKSEEEKKELILKSEEEKKELIRKTEEEKKERDTQLIEIHQQFLEAMKNGSLGNTTNNTQNNQFNLQFYLNETCKDAINLDEFLKSIKLTTQDYVNTGEAGFIEGLTDIFRRELHKLEPHHRPLQCTDVKREVIYVKENDEWTKDIENKKSLNVVRRIDLSYQNMMYKWMEENPGYRAQEGPLVEDGIKYSVVCFGRNRLDGNEPIFRGKILKNVLGDISIKRGNRVITV